MNLGQFETQDTKGAWIHGLIIGQVPVLLEIQKVIASLQNLSGSSRNFAITIQKSEIHGS